MSPLLFYSLLEGQYKMEILLPAQRLLLTHRHILINL